MFKNV